MRKKQSERESVTVVRTVCDQAYCENCTYNMTARIFLCNFSHDHYFVNCFEEKFLKFTGTLKTFKKFYFLNQVVIIYWKHGPPKLLKRELL